MTFILHYLSGLAEIKAGVESYIINISNHIDKYNFIFSILETIWRVEKVGGDTGYAGTETTARSTG